MKIKKAVIDNFKGIRHLELNFCDPYNEEPRPLTAILGDNGSGKTSVLQAIVQALILILQHQDPQTPDLIWEGYLVERISSLGPTRIDLTLWDDNLQENFSVHYHLGESAGNITPHVSSWGLGSKKIELFWLTQDRSLGMFHPTQGFKNRALENDWATGVANLRRALGDWWLAHVSPDAESGKDYIKELEVTFSRIYPGTRFLGVQLNPKKVAGWETSPTIDHYFIMEREGKKYDIAEMSSGEQAVFAILFEFVRNDIKKGIILIDELELHLHPPEQQALLAALFKIGPDCQFIITTHSPYIEGAIPDEHEIRLGLEEGRLCL